MTEKQGQYNVERDPDVIRPDCFREFTDPLYQPPTPEEVKAMTKMLGLSLAAAADFVGLADARGFRRYTAPKEAKGSRQLTYSAWRLLVLELYRRIRINKPKDTPSVGEVGPIAASLMPASWLQPTSRDVMDPGAIYKTIVGADADTE